MNEEGKSSQLTGALSYLFTTTALDQHLVRREKMGIIQKERDKPDSRQAVGQRRSEGG